AKFTGEYSVVLVRKTLSYLHQPIALLLSFYIFTLMASYLSRRVFQGLAPICVIPGISSLSMCQFWTTTPASETYKNVAPKSPDYSMLMNMQSKSFDHLLQELAGGAGLSLEIKKAEMATADLVARVRLSELSARDSIARTLSEFIIGAKKTSRGLQRLTSKVGGSVDDIMAVNDYALKSIQAARMKEKLCWSPHCLITFNDAGRIETDEVVAQTFDQAMSVLSINMERLVLEAEQCLHNLNDLEEQLMTLHQITAREDISISAAKSDLLEDLWTRLGGNRKSLRNFDHNLVILKGLAVYRQQAFVHIVAAIQTLQGMSEDMEDIRERVAAPDLAGAKIPVEVHIQSIQVGLDRLRHGRMMAKILEEDAICSAL
ncbi:hypothetical protein HYPSUDRAFT_121024, partial [Hypholoma sublateritium FD-334 SS-4]